MTDDLISRQAAIEALKRAEALTRAFGYHFVIDTILELPSAQPEIIRCKECKYYRDGDCWHEWDNDGRIYYQSVIDEPNPDDYCSRAERKEHEVD